MDIGQAALDAIVVIRKSFVVEAEEVQHGCVKIVPGGRVLD